ncbi:MAG TPA: pyridoxamine 5'-phosphate oxidase family protein [Cellvibrio sp.]|nr:pyridoxamine 5'-phosphate oxidase family protein [Cellvibrio sp.]
MGQQYSEMLEKHQEFIARQKIFFVGTATADSRINVSPKGMDSLRVLDGNRVIWLNVTGSGNETAAHVQISPRMTIMFAAFEGNPMILRLYGTARVIHKGDAEWETLFAQFEPIPGARQIFDMTVELVQSSCGMSIPFFDYRCERTELSEWAEKKGEQGIEEYWVKKNQKTIDGIETHILEKSAVSIDQPA